MTDTTIGAEEIAAHPRDLAKDVHEVDQPIREVVIRYDDYQNNACGLAYCVGMDGVTRIEACKKCGEYSHIPYLRIWSGDRCIAEFSQHHVAGVFFAKSDEEISDEH